MARFSDRYGYTSVRDVMQLEHIDDQLKNGLWSIFYETIVRPSEVVSLDAISASSEFYVLLTDLWKKLYKLPVDTIPQSAYSNYRSYSKSSNFVRNNFYKLSWFDIYNFLEFVAQNIMDVSLKSQFIEGCNEALQQEMAGYRFVGDEITQITSDEEIAEIEQAIDEANTNAVSSHLRRALELLSDNTEPDYRNSIKESISSVEALCKKLTGEATLGQALKRLDADGTIQTHPALNGAFRQLYGYTSDASGIRHALLEEDSLDFEDAKFMLVSCSAFVNYLQAKAFKTA
jgi:hypothetical protein